jgi:uncharacterized membrane protein YtjA (UPF0391 family)
MNLQARNVQICRIFLIILLIAGALGLTNILRVAECISPVRFRSSLSPAS